MTLLAGKKGNRADTPKSETVVSVSGLSKQYRLAGGFRDRLRWPGRSKTRKDSNGIWALRDVSFSLKRGESLGIIGKNGSGKSTLLQIVAGISAPTLGSVSLNGTVGALLELGTGFYPEFTGRENVFLAGAVLGFSRRQILSRLEEIRDFSEIGDFFDQPVRTYSNGMFLRLAFAVQACLRPDIFLVDEVLSVGDIFFQQKCNKRMEELMEQGMSLILVSHDHLAIQKYGNKTLLLNDGVPVFLGSPAEAIGLYHSMHRPPERRTKECAGPARFDGFDCVSDEGRVKLRELVIRGEAGQGPDQGFQTGELITLEYAFEIVRDMEVPVAALQIVNRLNITVHGKSSLHTNAEVPARVAAGSVVRVRQTLQLSCEPGEYLLGLGLAETSAETHRNAADLETSLLDNLVHYLLMVRIQRPLMIKPRSTGVKRPFYGVANLPGTCAIEVLEPDS
ncbi:MAG: ABC transporter ATP-binding protein [Thermodesulfobacteriota bacterium]